MRRLKTTWTRRLAAPLAAVVVLTVAAPPVQGADNGGQAPARPAAAGLAASAAAVVRALPGAALTQAAQPAPAGTDTASKPFFKTGKGVAVIVLMAVGLGLSINSMKSDRDKVLSPIR